jgi:hypothetical protein
MTFSKLLVCFGTFAMAVASAASSYSVTLFHPSIIGGTELKAGDYKIMVDGEKATIRAGKQIVEAAVKVETGNDRFPKTAVKYTNGDGKYHILEIRIGGTNDTLVFNN